MRTLKPLMMDFYIWLQSEVMRNLDSQMGSDEWVSIEDNHEIWWIKNLLNTPIDDERYYCVWHIIAPYLVNIKGLSKTEASDIISAWLDKCSSLKRLSFSKRKVALKKLRYYHLPIGRDNLKREVV